MAVSNIPNLKLFEREFFKLKSCKLVVGEWDSGKQYLEETGGEYLESGNAIYEVTGKIGFLDVFFYSDVEFKQGTQLPSIEQIQFIPAKNGSFKNLLPTLELFGEFKPYIATQKENESFEGPPLSWRYEYNLETSPLTKSFVAEIIQRLNYTVAIHFIKEKVQFNLMTGGEEDLPQEWLFELGVHYERLNWMILRSFALERGIHNIFNTNLGNERRREDNAENQTLLEDEIKSYSEKHAIALTTDALSKRELAKRLYIKANKEFKEYNTSQSSTAAIMDEWEHWFLWKTDKNGEPVGVLKEDTIRKNHAKKILEHISLLPAPSKLASS